MKNKNISFSLTLQITVIYTCIHLITCCDLSLGKFPSTRLKPVLQTNKMEKIKAISEMCAKGNDFDTSAHSCLENLKTY